MKIMKVMKKPGGAYWMSVARPGLILAGPGGRRPRGRLSRGAK
jgi:hypothetical protein